MKKLKLMKIVLGILPVLLCSCWVASVNASFEEVKGFTREDFCKRVSKFPYEMNAAQQKKLLDAFRDLKVGQKEEEIQAQLGQPDIITQVTTRADFTYTVYDYILSADSADRLYKKKNITLEFTTTGALAYGEIRGVPGSETVGDFASRPALIYAEGKRDTEKD